MCDVEYILNGQDTCNVHRNQNNQNGRKSLEETKEGMIWMSYELVQAKEKSHALSSYPVNFTVRRKAKKTGI